ncbi:hypothetical protein HY224_01985 [Candidatus Uhrbacteria bacterium]|nr:hypothetical protein [Candidatus Uhrbacteria bacterium]
MSIEQPKHPEAEINKEYVEEKIRQAPARIEKEFTDPKRKGNPWLACANSQLAGIQGFLEMIKPTKEFTAEQIKKARLYCRELRDDILVLLPQYKDKETPRSVKDLVLAKIAGILG